ncbi:MAG: penicillin-binding protein 2 [Patescibacteria group bacterium]
MTAIEVFSGRVRFLFVCFLILGVCLLTKLYFVQIVQGETFTEKADRQYAPTMSGVFDRGAIYFTDKNGRQISAATVQSGYVLTINPVALVDADGAFEALNAITPLESDVFNVAVAKTDDPYEEIAEGISKDIADEITALRLPGVSFYKEQWRAYPAGSRAAHTLGFVGFEGDARVGQYGLERYYEHVLSRGDESAYKNFFAEVFSNIEEVTDIDEGKAKGSLVTTIEPTVQGVLEDSLAYVADTWDVKTAGAVIMDPMTGDIIAIAGYPTFDPNNFSDVESLGVFANPIVEKVYEMGSIVKPLTMAAGLDAGVVTPDTTYNDKGKLTIEDYTISNYDGRGRGISSMYQVLGQSLNTGMAFVVGELGNKRFADYFRAYGLGEETGIDLPGEVSGFLAGLDSPRDIEYVTAAYGQGIAVTPIAMTRALAALGNGGMLVTPHVVKEINYDLGITKSIGHPTDERVLSTEASRTITRMLVRVVDEWLLGGTVMKEHYSIAAKTGTAQIADKVNRGYYDDRYLHSFFGYFPAYDPKFIVFLYAEEPKGVNYASETLTHPFMDIAEFLINYYEIPPDR